MNTMKELIAKRSFLNPTARRLIRSYGLLILIALAFLTLAMFVRETPRTVPTEGLGVTVVEIA